MVGGAGQAVVAVAADAEEAAGVGEGAVAAAAADLVPSVSALGAVLLVQVGIAAEPANAQLPE